MKLVSKETTYLKKIVVYHIKLDNGKTVNYWKSWEQDDAFDQYDSDVGIDDDASKKIIDAMTEEEQEAFHDLTYDLK
jgi:saccharopine dehydrogenase-like NADP-dependent oxidoreductase